MTVIAYGNTRDLVTGVEAVLADGRIVNGLSKLRKDNTGYDVKGLFIGAEGTLGIVTAASLRLFPNPRARATAFVGLTSPEDALNCWNGRASGLRRRVTSFELIGRIALDITVKNGLARKPAATRAPLVRADGSGLADARRARRSACRRARGGASRAGSSTTPSIASSLEQRTKFWRLRESIPEAQIKERASIKHDVSVAVGLVPALIGRRRTAVEAFAPGARVVAFGHLGDGNIHFNVSQPIGADPQAFLDRWDAMNEIVHGIVARLGGSYSAEHGVGQLKRGLLARNKDPASLAIMRQIKAALDPNGDNESGQGAVMLRPFCT